MQGSTETTVLSERLAEVEDALNRRDLPRSLKLLGGLEDSKQTTSDASASELSRYHFAHARYHNYVGELSKALLGVELALNLAREARNYSLAASQKMLLGVLKETLGNPEESIEAYNEALAFRRRAEEYDKLYGPLVNIGLAHFKKGSLSQARRVLIRAEKCALRYSGPDELRVCRLNRSRVALLMGDYKECLTLLPERNDPKIGDHDRAFVLQSLGMLNTFMMQKDKASRYLSQASDMFGQLGRRLDQVICREYLGLNEHFSGSNEEAKSIFEDILSEDKLDPSSRAQTLRMLTETLVAKGDCDLALAKALEAEEETAKVREQIELGALYRAYGRIYAKEGAKHRAREFFQMSIGIQRRTRARYELALSYLACGKSSVFSEPERNDYLRRAKELFASLDVPERVKQIGALSFATIRLPLLGLRSFTAKRILAVIGLPSLALCLLASVLSTTVIGESWARVAAFVGSGILMCETIIVMAVVKHRERKTKQ